MRPDLPTPLRFLAFDFDGTLTEDHLNLYTRALVAATVPVPGAAQRSRRA